MRFSTCPSRWCLLHHNVNDLETLEWASLSHLLFSVKFHHAPDPWIWVSILPLQFLLNLFQMILLSLLSRNAIQLDPLPEFSYESLALELVLLSLLIIWNVLCHFHICLSSRCLMCEGHSEAAVHHFCICSFAVCLWQIVLNTFGFGWSVVCGLCK